MATLGDNLKPLEKSWGFVVLGVDTKNLKNYSTRAVKTTKLYKKMESKV